MHYLLFLYCRSTGCWHVCVYNIQQNTLYGTYFIKITITQLCKHMMSQFDDQLKISYGKTMSGFKSFTMLILSPLVGVPLSLWCIVSARPMFAVLASCRASLSLTLTKLFCLVTEHYLLYGPITCHLIHDTDSTGSWTCDFVITNPTL